VGGKRQQRQQGKRIARANQKLTKEQIEIALNSFYSIKNPKELCELLDISYDRLLSVFFSRYNSFKILKKGKEREIQKPDVLLLEVQIRLSYFLNCAYINTINSRDIHNSYAYIPALKENTSKNSVKNIVSNANNHTNKKLVANLDLVNFFNSIHKSKIVDLFKNEPFNFNNELIDFIAEIVTDDNSLPVGAATSPILSNFIMLEIDEQFQKIPNIIFSRFSDDLTFSTDFYSISEFENILSFVIKIIDNSGFKINYSKKTIKKSTQKQIVTGIIVNKKVNVDRKYIRNIRAILHSITTIGWLEACEKYVELNKSKFLRAIRNYFITENNWILSDEILYSHISYSKEWYFNKSLRAKIEHIGYVKGKEDVIYRNLLQSYLNLIESNGIIKKVSPKLALINDIVFVTNATANSIVFYAYSFLKNCGLNDYEISDLRSKFYFNGSNKISYEEILRNFQNQSAYFINLFTYMTNNDRFESFVTETENQNRFHKIFKNSSNSFALMRQYNRKVYHANNECENLRNDFSEGDKYFKNTGVFFEENKEMKQKYYVLKRSFLDALNMRKCEKCE
jgi:RNA-directed DNA polymerase